MTRWVIWEADLPLTTLGEVIEPTKSAREIHIVLDNLSAHKTKAVGEFVSKSWGPLQGLAAEASLARQAPMP